MPNDDITKLKEEIVRELGPLVTDDKLSPEEKYQFYFSIASSTGQIRAVRDAFEAAKSIDEAEAKTAALMELLELSSRVEEVTYKSIENVDGEVDDSKATTKVEQ